MNKNILLVANWDSNVGYAWWLMENFWATIAREFSKSNHQSILIYPSISKIPKTIQDSPIEILEHNFDQKNFRSLLRLISIIRSKKIAYLYLSDKPETSFFYIFLRLFGIKKIIIHDHTPGERPTVTGIKKSLKKLYKRLPFINADAFIAVTDYIKQRMLNSSCLPSYKCFVAKNGINPIGRNPEYRYYAHDQFNLPHDAVLLITTGRANHYKRIDFMIEAFAEALRNNDASQHLYFIYCGDGPHLIDFKALVKRQGLEKEFIFAGNRTDVRQLLQSCDIGIQASKGEVGYSLSILEYMSAGLATLVPDNPSVCQAITNNENGMIFSQLDTFSLAEKLSTLISDSKLRKNLGSKANETVQNYFNLSNTNIDLINIISRYFI
ncbi:MAG: glycosyltransferase [Gammaproteobacteria bacterium]|nr:glycosyltransferase [Gammaproteobacteria bacterium]